MESDEDTGGEDVASQDPPVQDDHLEKNSRNKKKEKREIKEESYCSGRRSFESPAELCKSR